VVEEIAALPEPRPYLVMLGHMDENSPPIINLATQKLGKDGFIARSVPYVQVAQYYQAADIFVLGSLQEGFGRVYLEAMIHGLPCIVNDQAVMRYVLGEYGIFADLLKSGAMSAAINDLANSNQSSQIKIERREYVRQKFSWQNLTPAYLEMFRNCLK
jgi:glycosyltransferase involved in cell wall biosynthesis